MDKRAVQNGICKNCSLLSLGRFIAKSCINGKKTNILRNKMKGANKGEKKEGSLCHFWAIWEHMGLRKLQKGKGNLI